MGLLDKPQGCALLVATGLLVWHTSGDVTSNAAFSGAWHGVCGVEALMWAVSPYGIGCSWMMAGTQIGWHANTCWPFSLFLWVSVRMFGIVLADQWVWVTLMELTISYVAPCVGSECHQTSWCMRTISPFFPGLGALPRQDMGLLMHHPGLLGLRST